MLKKPSILQSSYHTFYCPQTSLSINAQPRSKIEQIRSRRRRDEQRRPYATVHPDIPISDQPDDIPWPRLAHPSSVPSPYQIFQLERNAPYSKRRFYSLVKLYHPDRIGHKDCSEHLRSLSRAVKMERYRLVVAANDILSDHTKRKAYDRDGAGWGGRPENGANKRHYWDSQWSGFDTHDSPFQNATWEDWEKWYQRNDRARQDPVYVSNGGFLSLIVLAVFLGGYGQSLRVDSYSTMFKRQVERAHDDASRYIRKRRVEAQLGNRDERLQSFLKVRDPYGYGIEDPREEKFRLMFPEPEACSSDNINQQGSQAPSKPSPPLPD